MPDRTRIRLPIVATACLALLALVLSACGGSDTGDKTVKSDDVPISHVGTTWVTSVASDLPSLIDATGTVFVGTVNGPPVQREESLGLGGRTDEGGRRDFPISRFEVTVDQAIAGNVGAGETVFIDQAGGTVTNSDGFTQIILLEGDTLIEPGARYLFFANEVPGGALSTAPFARLPITGGAIDAPELWSKLGALKALDGKPVDEATAEVARAR